MPTKSAPKGARVRIARKSGTSRFFATRNKILAAIAASLTLATVAMPASASNWWSLTPTVTIGSAALNVRNFGAMGNGVADDTAHILPRSERGQILRFDTKALYASLDRKRAAGGQ